MPAKSYPLNMAQIKAGKNIQAFFKRSDYLCWSIGYKSYYSNICFKELSSDIILGSRGQV